MRIGPLDGHESAAAVALWHAAGLTRPWNDPHADLARALAGPASTVLAAREDGQLVGTVMVGDDGHRGWLYYLAVAAERRGAGIGRELVAAAEAWLRVRGCVKVQLMVRNGAPTGGFYAALGYADSGVRVLGRRLDGDALFARHPRAGGDP